MKINISIENSLKLADRAHYEGKKAIRNIFWDKSAADREASCIKIEALDLSRLY